MAGLGFAGCPSSKPSGRLRGQRKDPDYPQGHRLREPDFPAAPTRQERLAGVILGGGVAGLSAGWRWTRAGLTDYRLLELESQVGGNSRALTYPSGSAPIGAHYLPVPNTEARAVRRLLTEMGLLTTEKDRPGLDPRHLCHSRQERLFYEGEWRDGLIPHQALSEVSQEQIARFQEHISQWSRRRDSKGRKVFALPLHFSSTEEQYLALDRISFAQYAKRMGWDDPFLLWYLNYACRDDFGGSLENCSAWAGLHYFASRDGGGLGDADDILVWPEGNNRLVKFLQGEQKGQIHPGSLVLEVVPSENGVTIDYLELATGERVRLQAEVCLFCLPSFLRPYLLKDQPTLDRFLYAPWLTANLELTSPPEDLEGPGFTAWDNVLYDSTSLGYVVSTHQRLTTAPNQPTVWTWYHPFPDEAPEVVRKTLLETQWEDWSQRVLGELEVVHADIRERCRRLDITVLGHGMIRPSVDFIWSGQMARARRPQGRLFFGHGDLSGMSLFEESQFRGVLAAEQALAALGMEPDESFL